MPRATRKLQHPHILHFLDLRDPAFESLWTFHHQTRPYAPPQETVREFLLLAIQSDPLDATKLAARRQAYMAASNRVRAHLAAALRAAADDLLSGDVPQGTPREQQAGVPREESY